MNFESEQSLFVEQELSVEELESNYKLYPEEQIPSELEIADNSSVDDIIVDKVPVRLLSNPSGTLQFSDTVRYAVEQSTQLEEYDAEALAETDEWIVSISAPQSVENIADQLGVESFDETGIIENTYVFEFPEQQTAQDIAQSLENVAEIEFFYPLVEQEKVSRFSPNDDLYDLQWHLNNTGQTGGTPGADANVEDAWDTVKGDGVVIGIVDDGLQYTHPDLSDRYRADLSYDFVDDDPDPAPSRFDDHGTAVAGIAAASGNNNIGVSGAAPNAFLAGIVYGFNDLSESQPLSYKPQDIDIYNNSWGPDDDGRTLEAPGPLTLAALENGVNSGRGGLGNIYVWAAGNGLESNDNVNYDGYANSRYTIAVSAIDHNGEQSEYSEPGAPIIVAAHSAGDGVGTVTTDLLGSQGYNGIPGDLDYTNDFGGTSSASPLAAGVVALMLDANPNLTWRDVQHVLVDTAAQNDSNDPDWVTNGGGHLINHKYGFGAIDADAAVSTALSWTNVDPEETTSSQATVGQTIPDNNATGISSTISITDDLTIEWVEVVFDADHTYRGDLKVTLTSPDGTESILAEVHDDFRNNYNNWVFSSARHWDESSLGDWTLTVTDGFSSDVGTWNNWQLNIYGTGTTVGGSDDNYEENDDIDSAYYPGYDWEQTWLSDIDGEAIVNDEDWYDIDVSSGEERLLVDLVSSDVNGDIDLELYDDNGNFLAESSSDGNNESIDYTVPSDGIYYLKVYPYSGSDVTYDLWWDDISSSGTEDSTVLSSEDYQIDALLTGVKWTDNLVTYSFYSDANGGDYYDEDLNVSEVSDAVKDNVRQILEGFESIIDLDFEEVADTTNSYGQIRIMHEQNTGGAAAVDPGEEDIAGDVFLGPGSAWEEGPGSLDYEILIHELGHALGLKHPGDYNGDDPGEPPFLPKSEDNNTNTVMTYSDIEVYGATLMPYDIKALHYIYGAADHNTSDTTYEFNFVDEYSVDGVLSFNSPEDGLKQTIWDNGGTDILDFSNTTSETDSGFRIDLSQGGIITEQDAYNTYEYTVARDTSGTTYLTTGYGTAIAYDTVIEDVINSANDDKIILNDADNTISGYSLNGSTGDDEIEGSDSGDTLDLSEYTSSDVTQTQNGNDLVIDLGSNGSVTLTDYYAKNDPINIVLGNNLPVSDDNYEENDDIDSAYYPGYDWEDTWLSDIDGEAIVNDDDWYDIDVSFGEEGLIVDLVSSDVDGDIDLELYDYNGNLLTGSYSDGNNESIDYTVPSGGIYYLRVYPDSGSDVTYDLWWDDIAEVSSQKSRVRSQTLAR